MRYILITHESFRPRSGTGGVSRASDHEPHWEKEKALLPITKQARCYGVFIAGDDPKNNPSVC